MVTAKMNKNVPKPHSPASNATTSASKGHHVADHPPKNDNNPVKQESGRRGPTAEVIPPAGQKGKVENTTSPIDTLLADIGWDTRPLLWLAGGTVAFLLLWKLA